MEFGIIFVQTENDYNPMIDTMFSDMINAPDTVKIIEKEKASNEILEYQKRVKVQRYTKGLLNYWLEKEYLLDEAVRKMKETKDKVIVFFVNSSFLQSRYPAHYLQKIKKKYKDVYYVLFYIDIFKHEVSVHANVLREQGLFDLVYTIEEEDAKDSGSILWPTPYSKLESFEQIRPSFDLYFCGVDKERGPMLAQIARMCEKKQIDSRMDVICLPEEKEVLEGMEGVTIKDKNTGYYGYSEVLTKSLEAKCILEVVQKGQHANTLRPYEAISYNRKLLTNNKDILKFPWYNPNYMQYFEDPEKIDYSWIKDPSEVNYHYDDRYSSIHLLNDMIARLQEKDCRKRNLK